MTGWSHTQRRPHLLRLAFLASFKPTVNHQAGRFRRLVGTMSPPDETDEAEIYVEGKKKMVDGFVRWCQKSDVGLNQIIKVKQVLEEDPTGLYDDFYVKTKYE